MQYRPFTQYVIGSKITSCRRFRKKNIQNHAQAKEKMHPQIDRLLLSYQNVRLAES